MWDLATGAEVRTFFRHGGRVNAVAVAGGLVLSGSDDGTVRVWRGEDATAVATLSEHGGAVNALALFADGAAFVSASDDFTVKLWRRGAERALCTYSAESPMTACTVACNGTIVAGDRTGRIHFLRLESAS
jgi:WD40 repeat protein